MNKNKAIDKRQNKDGDFDSSNERERARALPVYVHSLYPCRSLLLTDVTVCILQSLFILRSIVFYQSKHRYLSVERC